MVGILVYRNRDEYLKLRLENTEGYKMILATMKRVYVDIIGEAVIVGEESRIDGLERSIDEVLRKVNSEPIPITEREQIIKSVFLDANL